MTIDAHTIVAVVNPLGVVLDVKEAALVLDEGWEPYGQVTLTCAMPSAINRDLIDLRDGELRVSIRVRQDFGSPWSIARLTADFTGSVSAMTAFVGGQPLSKVTNRYYVPWNDSVVRGSSSRTLDLRVTERVFDDVSKEMRLKVTTDESLLEGNALLSTTPWDPGTTDLRDIVKTILASYGAVLDPSSLTATVANAAATIQQPGVTDWAYLDPMLQAASLRLWCDETRVWRISPRQAAVAGAVTITPTGTMTSHTDTMTYDPSVWYDAVVVEYRWTDALNVPQVAYDVAGTEPAKATLPVKLANTIYPGPGAAQGILTRGQGRGRVLDVEAVNDYSVSPGMAATIIPPDTASQSGYVASLSWRLPEAEMKITTRGLVEIPIDSFLVGPDSVTFASVASSNPTLAINAFDWSLV